MPTEVTGSYRCPRCLEHSISSDTIITYDDETGEAFAWTCVINAKHHGFLDVGSRTASILAVA